MHEHSGGLQGVMHAHKHLAACVMTLLSFSASSVSMQPDCMACAGRAMSGACEPPRTGEGVVADVHGLTMPMRPVKLLSGSQRAGVTLSRLLPRRSCKHECPISERSGCTVQAATPSAEAPSTWLLLSSVLQGHVKQRVCRG